MPHKVLKLSSKTGKIDFSLVLKDLNKEEILKSIEGKEAKRILQEFIQNWVKALRTGYLKAIAQNISIDSDKLEISPTDFVKSWIQNTPEVSIKIPEETIPIYKDNINTVIKYQYQDKVKKFLKKELKTFVIKNVPYLKRVHLTSKKSYEEAFYEVFKTFDISQIEKNDKKYLEVHLSLDLFKGLTRTKKLLLNISFRFRLKKRDFNKAVASSYKNILERIKTGEYKVKYAGISFKVTEGLSILIAYEVPLKPKKEPQNIMGVDLGQVVLAYAVIIPPEIAEKKLISSEKDVIASAAFNPPVNLYRILEKLWKVKSNLLSEYRKAQEQEKLGMQSPIKNRIRKDLKALRRKEKNLMKKVSEHIANEVIRLALKNNVKLIRLENLQGIKKNELKFPKWNFGQLQEFISSRAELYGIKVQKVKPYQTSIRCPKCGFISKENRPKRDSFLCKECGFSPTRKAGADFVGALNIAFDINSTSTKKNSS